MNGFRTLLVVGALLTALAGHARASEALLAHIAWLTEHSDLKYAGEPLPKVVTVADETLENLVGAGTIGTFDPGVNTIYLVTSQDGIERESTLVHELIHYLQFLDGRDHRTTCAGLLEPEAYQLEGEWREAHGLTAGDYDAFQVIMGVSACRMRGLHE